MYNDELIKELKDQCKKVKEECNHVQNVCKQLKNAMTLCEGTLHDKRSAVRGALKTLVMADDFYNATWKLMEAIKQYKKEAINAYQADDFYCIVLKNEDKYNEYRNKYPELKEQKVDEKTLRLLKARIIDLDIEVRPMNVLRALDINCLYELLITEKSTLMRCRNFGVASYAKLKESIESLGVKFGYYLRYDEDEKSYYGIKVDKE